MVNYCPICSQPVTRKPGRGRTPIYDTDKCADRAAHIRDARRRTLGAMVERRAAVAGLAPEELIERAAA